MIGRGEHSKLTQRSQRTSTSNNDQRQTMAEDSKATPTTKAKGDVGRGDGGLAIIGAGYGRTGTASMQEALNLLGFGPCYHMKEVFKDPNGVSKWDQVGLEFDNKKKENVVAVDWDDIFHGYKSTVDFPAAPYYKELFNKYPNAKVILNVRDPEKWWGSYAETISPSPPLWRVIYTITGQRSFQWDRMVENCVYKPIAGSRANARQKEAAIAGFNRHNEQVKATIPADKLLVFEVKEGWGPLCQFLGCPVPPKDTPFPHTNDTAQFKKFIAIRKKKALAILAAEVTLVIVVAGFLLWARDGGRNKSKSY